MMAKVDTALLTSTRQVGWHIVSCRLCRVRFVFMLSYVIGLVPQMSFVGPGRAGQQVNRPTEKREGRIESRESRVESREKEVKVGSW